MAVDRGGCFSDLIDKAAHKLRPGGFGKLITTSQVLLEFEATAL